MTIVVMPVLKMSVNDASRITNDASRNISEQCQNGTARFKNMNNCLNTNIYSYLETSGGQSSNTYLSVVHFFNTRVD